MKEHICWMDYLAEVLLQRFPDLGVSHEELTAFIDEKFQEKKYEVADELEKLRIRARCGDSKAAVELIRKMAEMPPLPDEN